MPIPDFRDDGWLPEGHWPATWEEIEVRFGGNTGSRRRALLTSLLVWRDEVRAHRLSGNLLLDGSFVSAKSDPGDVDAIFVFDQASEDLLRSDESARAALNHTQIKQSGLGDILVYAESTVRAFPSWCRLDGFDMDRNGMPKGVLEVVI